MRRDIGWLLLLLSVTIAPPRGPAQVSPSANVFPNPCGNSSNPQILVLPPASNPPQNAKQLFQFVCTQLDPTGFRLDTGTNPPTLHAVNSPTQITFVDGEIPAGAIDGVNQIFTLAHVPTAGSLQVFVAGLRAMPGPDYSLSNGVTITFPKPLPVGSTILTDYRTAF